MAALNVLLKKFNGSNKKGIMIIQKIACLPIALKAALLFILFIFCYTTHNFFTEGIVRYLQCKCDSLLISVLRLKQIVCSIRKTVVLIRTKKKSSKRIKNLLKAINKQV